MTPFVPYEPRNFRYFCHHMKRRWAKALCECVQEGRDWSVIAIH